MNCESGDSSGARPTGDIWRVIICPICAAQPREGGRSWKWTAPREDSRCLITWRPAHKFQNAFETSDYVAKVWKMFGSLWLWEYILSFKNLLKPIRRATISSANRKSGVRAVLVEWAPPNASPEETVAEWISLYSHWLDYQPMLDLDHMKKNYYQKHYSTVKG